ncbi:hypothetical protein B0I72DRAFT_136528 [Yarrowia lipolytica]|jgi:hypothetical protein|uniref:YALI0F13497p n=2 Tax=Yarrowia lipolytica TaxID=4952 RepID=Q6C1T6_YARLI|nr:YALI0F13497p [Yarrowia lipolytica CLIB122]AOW07134.1 hypothetical protein YALI1_F18023g [Yarrowia lipolytica]KAB8281251.1 hypothetical protein BKA91DRAFT_140482 [Yarrowia lipolytica]KAE8170447.1 hypothetical protein BKA90DRAFT_140793 [Yarrowia lipolytica]KAJ8055747.1 hypothetical protein LXG23DRAFT_17950 [Yarrowia lipolytica]QNQ00725.1 mRNA decay activator protein ZFP36L2 [Yarrowia lipolytica]|eukprot:XP_505376.1 YALI0F13497p [Yarrowia lipolytica CLIB122]
MLMSFEYGDGKGGNPANPTQQPQHPHQHQHQHQHSLLAHPKPVSFASSTVSSMDGSAQSSPVGSTADLTASQNGAAPGTGSSKQHDRLFSGFLSRPTSTRISSPFSLGIKSDIWGDDSSTTSQTSASSTSKFAPFEAPTPSSSSGSTVSQPAAPVAPQQQQQGAPRPSVVAAMSQANDFPGIDISYLDDPAAAPGAAGSAHSSNFATHTNSSVSLSALGYGTGFGTPTSATVPPGAPNAAYFEEYPQQPFDPWGEDKRRGHMGGPMMQPNVHQANGMPPNGMPNPMAMQQPLANGMHMQGMMPQMAPVTPTAANAVPQQQPRRKANINSELYKTEMCSSFQKTGSCSYGEKCQFAHGEHELKNVDRPPKWRSKLCQNWLRTGTCAYNDRCCFKHA